MSWPNASLFGQHACTLSWIFQSLNYAKKEKTEGREEETEEESQRERARDKENEECSSNFQSSTMVLHAE